MNQKVEAIILRTIKYGETNLIFSAFTKEFGVKSFFYKNAFSSKKKDILKIFPLNILEIEFEEKQNKELKNCKNVSNLFKHLFVQQNVYQSSIALFIAQIIYQSIKEVQQEIKLYDFLQDEIQKLNQLKLNYGDFSWIFLLNFSRFLGFYPNNEHQNKSFFDLQHGIFSDDFSLNSLNKSNTELWKKMLNSNLEQQIFNRTERKQILNLLLDYYKFHVYNFKNPKSFDIFQEVFN